MPDIMGIIREGLQASGLTTDPARGGGSGQALADRMQFGKRRRSLGAARPARGLKARRKRRS